MDHAVAAREAGLDLADEQVVPFGNPRARTPLSVGVEPKASDWSARSERPGLREGDNVGPGSPA